jgi:hypothetical protein
VDARDPLIEFDATGSPPGDISRYDQNPPFAEVRQFLHLDMLVFGRVGEILEREAEHRVSA